MEIKNKKGQLFTLMAIAILFLLFTSYGLYSIVSKNSSVKTRVKTMDSFVSSMESDLERKIYISGFRIIFLAENSIAKSGNYLDDFNNFFENAIVNGSSNEEDSDILLGATISEIILSVQEDGQKLGIDVNLYDIDIDVGQEDPWHVIVYMNYTLNVTDETNLARWDKKENLKAHIPIKNFEDPLFLLNTGGLISRKFNSTVFEGEYVSGNNVDGLLSHLNNGYYTNNSNAPSFIKRLEGKNEADINGIESFVDLGKLSTQGITVQDKSVVDYIYFSSLNPTSYGVQGMPSWFKIDDLHIDKYQVNGLLI